ncbi:hypothetical protein OIV41_32150, partial [Burkholderia pseudomallei]|nr:hypothetical protein [Burkholderia pseudomallei]
FYRHKTEHTVSRGLVGQAKHQAEGPRPPAGDVGGNAKAKAGEALDSAATAAQGGASVGVKGSVSAQGTAQ